MAFILPWLAQCEHAVEGNYSTLNGEYCGITRKSIIYDGSCFRWHRRNANIPPLTVARNATAGEVPWMALIVRIQTSGTFTVTKKVSFCSGSLIDAQWILTAAHCLGAGELRVYLGSSFLSSDYESNPNYYLGKNYYQHPDFIAANPDPKPGDIGLIDLGYAIPLNRKADYFETNSICLPAPDVVNTGYEYAFIAGWGKTSEKGLPLQMGYRLLNPYFKGHKKNIFHQSIGHQTYTCDGDSGGSLWQFYKGRAVIIGVHFYHVGRLVDGCLVGNGGSIAVRVSMYIDWISKITGLD